jgi:hypothetical protein
VNKPLPTGDDLFSRDPSRTFRVVEDTYRYTALDGAVELRITGLHRERGHLIGEITARTSLPGARTFGKDGTTLFTERVNLMFARDKQSLARNCAIRAATNPRDVRWEDLIEDFVQRVIDTEKEGEPLAWIHAAARTPPDRCVTVYGMPIYLDHPQVFFGQAATGKSMIALAMLGELGRLGIRSLILDWEMEIGVHKDRFDALGLPPTIAHMRCAAPLTVIADAVKQRCSEADIQFLVIDSAILACDGKPEDSIVAKDFHAALRRIGRGSQLIAHTRAEDPGNAREPQQQRPFGSVVWHNSARATWFVKRVNAETDLAHINNGIYNPKASFRGTTPPYGLALDLTERGDGTLDNITVRRTNLADEPELAATLFLKDRIYAALASGKMTHKDIADAVGAEPKTVTATLHRYKGRKFTLITTDKGGVHKWGRLEAHQEDR